jgi:pantetheine-phosphate adenylyltransferase
VAKDVRRAVCPGSYDPVTNGHVDVVTRAATLFDEVVVAVLYNPAKQGTFAVEERVSLIEESMATVSNLRVEAFADRLLVDVCRDLGATAIVKGLRGGTDFAYELPMALMNKHLTGIETVFLPGDPQFEHVSSSLVKEVVKYGGDVAGLVPDAVLAALGRQFGR